MKSVIRWMVYLDLLWCFLPKNVFTWSLEVWQRMPICYRVSYECLFEFVNNETQRCHSRWLFVDMILEVYNSVTTPFFIIYY